MSRQYVKSVELAEMRFLADANKWKGHAKKQNKTKQNIYIIHRWNMQISRCWNVATRPSNSSTSPPVLVQCFQDSSMILRPTAPFKSPVIHWTHWIKTNWIRNRLIPRRKCVSVSLACPMPVICISFAYRRWLTMKTEVEPHYRPLTGRPAGDRQFIPTLIAIKSPVWMNID